MLISKHSILVLVVTLALASLAQSTHDDGIRCEGDLISYYVVGDRDQASESCMASCENDSECVAYGIYSAEPNDDICVDFDWAYGGYADCSWYEDESQINFYDDPGCPVWGGDMGPDGVTAWEACCYCGGGYNPYDDYSFSYDYDDDITPVLYCSLYRDFRGFTDGNNDEECNVLSTSPPSFVPSVTPSVSLSLAPSMYPSLHPTPGVPSVAPSIGLSLAPSMSPSSHATRRGKAKKKKKKKKEKNAKGKRRTI